MDDEPFSDGMKIAWSDTTGRSHAGVLRPSPDIPVLRDFLWKRPVQATLADKINGLGVIE